MFLKKAARVDDSSTIPIDNAQAMRINEQEHKIALQAQKLLDQQVKLERLQRRAELMDAIANEQEAELLNQQLNMVRLERRASLLYAINGSWVGYFLVGNACYCVWHVTKCFVRHLDNA
jgi:hypothetical protein